MSNPNEIEYTDAELEKAGFDGGDIEYNDVSNTSKQHAASQEENDGREPFVLPDEVNDSNNENHSDSLSTDESNQPEQPVDNLDSFNQRLAEFQKTIDDMRSREAAANAAINRALVAERRVQELNDEIMKIRSSYSTFDLSDEDFSEFKKELGDTYPEFTDATIRALSSTLKKLSPKSFDQNIIGELVNKQAKSMRDEIHSEFENKFILMSMNVLKPNWRKTVESQEFKAYFSTLDPQKQEYLKASRDPEETASAITEFEEYQKKRQQEKKVVEQKQKDRINNLKAVVPIRGSARPASTVLSDKELEARGFAEGR